MCVNSSCKKEELKKNLKHKAKKKIACFHYQLQKAGSVGRDFIHFFLTFEILMKMTFFVNVSKENI